ncbi:Corrinoid adenosyltransferase [Sulfidibacter corallicola]|uniref:Corrinoid adenosyltransferase n=1 Tax=Sulfidibacter corallicola TaxID=2818388 RepID=A0A8A4TX67_SULCO|nr:cob(I)yrinic acid a,c-diamide adenosyltransferase [Sulfidibacter corallicola]QTD53937.1 cob(I)yrinic acid a,c-diamide adenosyltransferase [Sulfidibacter corallicola]
MVKENESGQAVSEDKSFNDPKLAITKVYTKTGDKGTTSLVGGQRVPKNHLRIEAYGTVDELNAFVGSLAQSVSEDAHQSTEVNWFWGVLVRIQHELFNLGSILATLPSDVHPKQPRIREADIRQLEADIDHCNKGCPPLRSFVLPGGSRQNTDLHICRTVCRRAERQLIALGTQDEVDPLCIQYLNRLSDAFFVWSRWINRLMDKEEVLWEPNKAASSSE